jgi:hypothetical protein
MGLLEGLEPYIKDRPCRVRTLVAELDQKDVDILLTALKSPDVWPAKTLSNALKIRGVLISDNAISQHRKGACSCGKID